MFVRDALSRTIETWGLPREHDITEVIFLLPQGLANMSPRGEDMKNFLLSAMFAVVLFSGCLAQSQTTLGTLCKDCGSLGETDAVPFVVMAMIG